MNEKYKNLNFEKMKKRVINYITTLIDFEDGNNSVYRQVEICNMKKRYS